MPDTSLPLFHNKEAGNFSTLERREFLKLTSIASLGLLLAPALRGAPNTTEEGVIKIESVIPSDKKLPAEWVKSLYGRGAPEKVSSEKGLLHVGMPVGGLFCGTVYLGGDGKLWVWDIFNANHEGVIPKFLNYEGRRVRSRDGAAYVEPENIQPSPFRRGYPGIAKSQAPKDKPDTRSNNEIILANDQFRQGFALRVNGQVRTLDRKGWKNVTFTGTYPVGTVDYSDPGSPVSVRLEGFSPFIPLNTDDSSLPVTLMRYTLKNGTGQSLQAEIGGWLENAVCAESANRLAVGVRKNAPGTAGFPHIFATGEVAPYQAIPGREDVVFEDFEKDTYEGWTVVGTAFGEGPLDNARIPPYMGDIGMHGNRAAVSHNVREGGNIPEGDAHTGHLLSRKFTIERHYIRFLIGGGHKGPAKGVVDGAFNPDALKDRTGILLLVDGKIVRSATGHNGNKTRGDKFDVRDLVGKEAQLAIIDYATQGWGNIIVDQIVFSDNPGQPSRPLPAQPDYGSFCLALAESNGTAEFIPVVAAQDPARALFTTPASTAPATVSMGTDNPLFGLRKTVTVPANGTVIVTFAIAWHFANIYLGTLGDAGKPDPEQGGGRHYAKRFKNAQEVAAYVTANLQQLTRDTFLWRDTWYDSTLPHWFLDRTFVNICSLATTTAHRFVNGRFYAWEGIGACPGTCTHVWQYAQAPARLFPDIERYTREHVDLNSTTGFNEELGRIPMRGEHGRGPAVDGQCGRIMGIWREHCMTPDDTFLKRVWPRAKKSVEFILNHDADGDGIIDGAQENTLDAAWFGQIAWISIQALGALAAGEKMAEVAGDTEFAKRCRERRLIGKKNIEEKLFNGKWFFQIPSPQHQRNFGTYNASYIDQLFGQSMAFQCGLGEIIDPGKARSALLSVWKYNFSLDLTEYLKHVRPLGRPYYVAGEGGTLMCTNALNEKNPYRGGSWTHGYLNECMTGFEHQYASHLMHVGLVQEALAVTRVIHDRYNAEKRNPFNEIECSDHYARAMASYGTFLSACGYDYNGPAGALAFAPQSALGADDFKAAFTTAEGWGTFEQKKNGTALNITLTLKYGKLRLNELGLAANGTGGRASYRIENAGSRGADASGHPVMTGSAVLFKDEPRVTPKATGSVKIKFAQPVTLTAGQELHVTLT